MNIQVEKITVFRDTIHFFIPLQDSQLLHLPNYPLNYC